MSFRFQGELEIWESCWETKHLFFCPLTHTDPMGGRWAPHLPQTLEVLTWTFVHTLTPHHQKFRERPNVLRLNSGPGTFTEKDKEVTRNVFFFCLGPLLGELELPLSLALERPCNQLLKEKLSSPLQRRALGCRLCPLPTAEFSEVMHRAIRFLLRGGYKFKPEPLQVIESGCSRGSNLLLSRRSPRTAADGGRFGAEPFSPFSFAQDLIDSDPSRCNIKKIMKRWGQTSLEAYSAVTVPKAGSGIFKSKLPWVSVNGRMWAPAIF